MFRNKVTGKRSRRKGTVMVQVALFGGTVAVGVAALAIDTGMMFSARQELQSAADAAALAAAAKLGGTNEALENARAEAAQVANSNRVMGENADLLDADVVFGHAVLVADKYDFYPNSQPYDAVRVTVRRDQTVSDGPVSLLFANTFGKGSAQISASAVAMLVPRDIALVIDLSGSMNDDSELRHYTRFESERSGYIDGVQINLNAIWTTLPVSSGKAGIRNGRNPAQPGAAAFGDNQPATGAGTPQTAAGYGGSGNEPSGGSGAPAGPRFGWMTGWGDEIALGSYNPTSDSGLYCIPQNSTCTDSDVIANLAEAGYTSSERSALLSGSSDFGYGEYQRRVQVLLGLAGWKSGKSGGKYSSGGNGDNRIDSNELTQNVTYPYTQGGWDDFVNYMSASNTFMASTDSNLKYRYGLKTFVNYVLERQAEHSQTPELASTPEEPLYSVKNAVQVMIDDLIAMNTMDHVSLETFAQYGNHRLDLFDSSGGVPPAVSLQNIADRMFTYQAAYESSTTNIGAGVERAIEELTSERARSAASKMIILLTDGKPNVDSSNRITGNNDPSAVGWAEDQAQAAKDQGMSIFTIGVGGDVNEDLLTEMASKPENYFFADNQPDPTKGGQPYYVAQLREIFRTLGGRRPVQLIK